MFKKKIEMILKFVKEKLSTKKDYCYYHILPIE